MQIGLIGLVEYEWLATLSTISPEDVDYTDYVECAQSLVPQLTAEVQYSFSMFNNQVLELQFKKKFVTEACI